MIVLILVVMEDGLVPQSPQLHILAWQRLNPCCNGRWSRTAMSARQIAEETSLNPCCNGRWSRTDPANVKFYDAGTRNVLELYLAAKEAASKGNNILPKKLILKAQGS